MNWVKENKFEAGLLALAVAAAIGTYFVASSKSEEFDEAKQTFDAAAGQLQNLERRQPYPSDDRLEARRKEVAAYRGKVEGLQESLTTYRPKEFQKIKPAEFTTKMNQVGGELRALYEQRGIKFPEKWQMGFEVYIARPPKDEATDYLGYQLDGLVWLFKELAESGPSELLNVYRAALPIEQGTPMVAKGSNVPFVVLPLELTFRGRESSLRQILSRLAGSKEYFFVVRSLRVQNTKMDKAPRTTDVKFESAPVGLPGGDPFEGFGDLGFPDAGTVPAEEGGENPVVPAPGDPVPAPGDPDPAPVEPAPPAPDLDKGSQERILGQVLGAEELHVFLQLDLVLFRDDVNFPATK